MVCWWPTEATGPVTTSMTSDYFAPSREPSPRRWPNFLPPSLLDSDLIQLVKIVPKGNEKKKKLFFKGTFNPVSLFSFPPNVFRLYVTRSALSNLSPGVRCCVSFRQLTLWNTPRSLFFILLFFKLRGNVFWETKILFSGGLEIFPFDTPTVLCVCIISRWISLCGPSL